MKVAREQWPQIANRYEAGESCPAIARAYGLRSEAAVRYILEQQGVQRRSRGQQRQWIDMEPIVQAYDRGESLQTLEARFKHTSYTLAKRLRELGVVIRRNSEYQRLFSDAQEREFVELYLTGATLNEIALEHGTDKSLVANVLERQGVRRRTTWESRHLRGTEKYGSRRAASVR